MDTRRGLRARRSERCHRRCPKMLSVAVSCGSHNDRPNQKYGSPPSRGPDDAMISHQQDGLMFGTQEELDLALLQYVLEFNETRFASPGVVVYKNHKETKTGVLLETFPVSGAKSSPAGASSFFLIDREDLEALAKR